MRPEQADGIFAPLWITYILVPLLAGLDKFFYLLVDWDRYIAEPFLRLMPFSGHTFMLIVGVIEIAVAVAAMTSLRRLASYVASVWLMIIAINLIVGGFYDVAVRDLAMAVGAFTLGQLAAARGEAIIPSRRGRAPSPAQQV